MIGEAWLVLKMYSTGRSQSGGQMLDLNSLIAPGSGFTLQWASGISDTGYISELGTTPDGLTHACLLTPVAEPGGLVLLGTGVVGLPGYTAWRRARPRAAEEGFRTLECDSGPDLRYVAGS
jgi:hypothetical protein